MKFFSVSILMFCLMAATFSQGILIAFYNLNKSYVANELCVKRNEIHNQCKGQCFLAKQMKTEQKKDNNTTNKETTSIQLFYSVTNANHKLFFHSKTIYTAACFNFSPQEFVNSLFHPPGI